PALLSVAACGPAHVGAHQTPGLDAGRVAGDQPRGDRHDCSGGAPHAARGGPRPPPRGGGPGAGRGQGGLGPPPPPPPLPTPRPLPLITGGAALGVVLRARLL